METTIITEVNQMLIDRLKGYIKYLESKYNEMRDSFLDIKSRNEELTFFNKLYKRSIYEKNVARHYIQNALKFHREFDKQRKRLLKTQYRVRLAKANAEDAYWSGYDDGVRAGRILERKRQKRY